LQHTVDCGGGGGDDDDDDDNNNSLVYLFKNFTTAGMPTASRH
jgi:hypothetical protein